MGKTKVKVIILGLMVSLSIMVQGEDKDKEHPPTFGTIIPSPREEELNDTTEKTKGAEGDYPKPAIPPAEIAVLARMYLISIYNEMLSVCTGVFITNIWIVTSGICLSKANDKSFLKICHHLPSAVDPKTCLDTTFATKIIFPDKAWYNNIAFVETDGSLNVSTTLGFTPKDQKPKLTDCIILGLTFEGSLEHVYAIVRRACKTGYYCVDDPTGWGCDLSLGSLLICSGAPRGIYAAPHENSCLQHFLLEPGQHPDQFDSDSEKLDWDPIEEDHWSLLYFINFDAYQHLITMVLEDKFHVVEDQDDPEHEGDHQHSD